MNGLKRCPSCRGDSEVITFPVGDDRLWQVNCRSCGLGTELNDDRMLAIQHWNRRDQEERLRNLVTILGVLLPTVSILMIFLGVLLGGSITS